MVLVPILLVFGAIMFFMPQVAFADMGSHDELTFSLEIPEKQEVVLTEPDGSTTIVGIEPVPTNSLMSTIALGNGTGAWKVYWYTAALNTSYQVQISNYNIIRCFDNYSSGVGIAIDECTLSWGSKWSQQTTRHHETVSGLNVSSTRFLNGNISGHSLVTSVNYG
jgi:hypothetical protein